MTEQVDVQFNTGHETGLIGDVVRLHADFYSKHFGFGPLFEAKVAEGLAEFVPRLVNSGNQIWSARLAGNVVGSIAIDSEDLRGDSRARLAHLRWFILREDVQGMGLGQQLITRALEFCDGHHFSETHLWTFDQLKPARKLYERHGFELVEEAPGTQWGTEVIEQKFIRTHRPST